MENDEESLLRLKVLSTTVTSLIRVMPEPENSAQRKEVAEELTTNIQRFLMETKENIDSLGTSSTFVHVRVQQRLKEQMKTLADLQQRVNKYVERCNECLET